MGSLGLCSPQCCHLGVSSFMVSAGLTVVPLLLPWMALRSRMKAALGLLSPSPSSLFPQPVSMLLTPESLRPKQVVFQSEDFNSGINRVLCSGNPLSGLFCLLGT